MHTLPNGASLIAANGNTNRCLVVVGGVHGNEPAGIRAIQIFEKLVRDGDWEISGAVYTLIGNPTAALQSVRFIDENLNRVFSRREKKGTHEEKRSDEISQWFDDLAIAHSNLRMIDLHSVSMDDTKMVVFN